MKETTLVIMAAGIGSRFGKGIKQLTPVGPSGELIMDYSIHDALAAGFDRVVFILRKDIFEEFQRLIGRRIETKAKVEYVFQELEDLPEGFSCPADRTKPWGTGQAVLAGKDVITGPFAVINADDYYGKEPYVLLHDWLVADRVKEEGASDICMAGFLLGNTLSDNGGVTRGVCEVDESGYLTGIDETKNIVRTPEGAAVLNENGERRLDPKNLVSMNMWGFDGEFPELLESGFQRFLASGGEKDLKSEFLLPIFIDELIRDGKAKVTVLPTDATWFGVTYQEDKEAVIESFAQLVRDGEYNEDLYA